MATSQLLVALRDGSGVGTERANDVQRELQSQMDSHFKDWWPEVCISYATGSREGIDSRGAGPGLLAAAIIVHKLHEHGIACATGLHVPDSVNWKDFLSKISGRFAKCKVLIVLLTRPFYKSNPCLAEVFKAAEAKNVTLIPLRCDEPLPGKEQQWPDVGSEHARMLDEVQSTLGSFNALPPRGLFFDSPATLDQLVQRVKGLVTNSAEPTPPVPPDPPPSGFSYEHNSAQASSAPTTPREGIRHPHFMHFALQPPPGSRPHPLHRSVMSPSPQQWRSL